MPGHADDSAPGVPPRPMHPASSYEDFPTRPRRVRPCRRREQRASCLDAERIPAVRHTREVGHLLRLLAVPRPCPPAAVPVPSVSHRVPPPPNRQPLFLTAAAAAWPFGEGNRGAAGQHRDHQSEQQQTTPHHRCPTTRPALPLFRRWKGRSSQRCAQLSWAEPRPHPVPPSSRPIPPPTSPPPTAMGMEGKERERGGVSEPAMVQKQKKILEPLFSKHTHSLLFQVLQYCRAQFTTVSPNDSCCYTCNCAPRIHSIVMVAPAVGGGAHAFFELDGGTSGSIRSPGIQIGDNPMADASLPMLFYLAPTVLTASGV